MLDTNQNENIYMPEHGYIINKCETTNLYWLHDAFTGKLIKTYKTRDNAIKRAKVLIERNQSQREYHTNKLNDAGSFELAAILKAKLKSMRHVLGILRSKNDEQESSKCGMDVANQLLNMNGDLNLIQTRINNLEILMKRIDDPDYGFFEMEQRI